MVERRCDQCILHVLSRDAETDSVFFSTYFMARLLNEGHRDHCGMYQYENVKLFSNAAPGGDIFAMKKIILPIHVSGHWFCGVVDIAGKKIQIFDSIEGQRRDHLNFLFRYIQDEHLEKKNSPLPDIGEWELVPSRADTPRQTNGMFTIRCL